MIYGNMFQDGHSRNSMFGLEDTVHRHNPTHTPRMLRQAFLARGIELNTPDINAGRAVAFELHVEGRPLGPKTIPRYLLAMENPNINRLNANADYCREFDLVFAWDTRLFSLPNVIPQLVPHPLVHDTFTPLDERDIFCCLINANKAFRESQPTDLYQERLHTIRWYERHAPDSFHLYGMGWDKPTPAFTLAGRLRRALGRLQTRLLGIPPFPSFRGEVSDKASVLRRAGFSYCYENSRDLSNYITEKIFDSMVSGCVPIYWGADNVLDHIPADCFIDRRKFRDTSEVHRHLLSITPTEYAAYQRNIAAFLKGEAARKFSSETFVRTVVDRVCSDLARKGIDIYPPSNESSNWSRAQ